MRQIGYFSEWLLPAQVHRRCPGVDPDALPEAGGVFAPNEGWVDLRSLVDRLARELVAAGGTIRTDAGPAEVLLGGDGVSAVSFAGERQQVDAALLATGAEVPEGVARVGGTIPDATPTPLLLRTTPVRTPLRAVLNTPRLAVRPTADGSLVLDSGWSEREVLTRDDGTYEVRQETVDGLLCEASAVLDHVGPLTLASYGVGPKPIPGDGEPVLGELGGVPGYYVAFTHSGATLALVIGELLADEIVDGKPGPELLPFRPSRFVAAGPTGVPGPSTGGLPAEK